MFKVDSGTGSWNQSWLPEMLVTSPVPDIEVTGGLGQWKQNTQVPWAICVSPNPPPIPLRSVPTFASSGGAFQCGEWPAAGCAGAGHATWRLT